MIFLVHDATSRTRSGQTSTTWSPLLDLIRSIARERGCVEDLGKKDEYSASFGFEDGVQVKVWECRKGTGGKKASGSDFVLETGLDQLKGKNINYISILLDLKE
jgi:hypothetical protein